MSTLSHDTARLDHRVVTRVRRPEPDDVEALSAFGVATVHEAYLRRGLMDTVRPVVPDTRICGPAVTSLNAAGDNLMLHAAIEQCRPGDVLVVATTAPSRHGMFGELLATQCRARGIAGVVLEAGARDTRELREMGYPTWSAAVSAAGTAKTNPGWVNVPVECDGVIVNPGDVVVADDDGVVVVARDDVPEVAVAAAEREEREAGVRRRFESGELSLDVSDLRQSLERLGVRYTDEA